MHLEFSIKSTTHYLGFLREIIRGANIPEAAKTACSLALVEAVNNAIFHAHKEDGDKWIDILIDSDDKKVTLGVGDRGKGFEMMDPDIPNIEETHGRGIFIIRSLMQEVEYKRGEVNWLRMEYYL